MPLFESPASDSPDIFSNKRRYFIFAMHLSRLSRRDLRTDTTSDHCLMSLLGYILLNSYAIRPFNYKKRGRLGPLTDFKFLITY